MSLTLIPSKIKPMPPGYPEALAQMTQLQMREVLEMFWTTGTERVSPGAFGSIFFSFPLMRYEIAPHVARYPWVTFEDPDWMVKA